MKVINENENVLSVGWLLSQIQPGTLTLSMVLKGTYKIECGKTATQSPNGPDGLNGDEYLEEDESGSVIYSTDFVPYKPRADLLLNASAYAPGGIARSDVPVGFSVGSYQKNLIVYGDRHWLAGGLGGFHSNPQTFTEMRLCYENALGGIDDVNNPNGKGRNFTSLPNIELVDQQVTSSDILLAPAGLSPLHQEWAQRKSLAGTYSSDYTEKLWPAFPADFDSGYFNSAPPDQQVAGYLRGDESLVMYNLHPEYIEYKTTLPGTRARCFLEGANGLDSVEPFRELELNLDTMWVDMHTEKLVLIWRGLIAPVTSAKLKEFRSVFVMTENLNEPDHDIGYYRSRMQQVIAAEDAEFEIEEPSAPDYEAEMDAAMVEVRTDVEQAELEFVRLSSEAETAENRHLALVRDQLGDDASKLGVLLAAVPLTQTSPQIDRTKLENIRAENPEQAREVESLLAELDFAEAEIAAMDAQGDAFDAEFVGEPPVTREAVIAAVREGEMLKEVDLSDLDLSCLDLSGLYAVDCRCHKTNFSSSNLTGAILTESSLYKANLTDAKLTDAILDKVSFMGVVCRGALFNGVSVNGAYLAELDLSGADFSQAKGELADFSGAILNAACFTSATLPLSDFDGCYLEGADFSTADLSNADFTAVQAKGCSFNEAHLTGLRSGGGANFSASSFRCAKASGSMWEECVLIRTDFTQAELNGAQFVDADMTQCTFDRVSAVNANFEGANMRDGWFSNSNFLRCSFERAKLSNAKIVGSNLYESGFLDVEIEDTTDFTGSFLVGTLLEIRDLMAEKEKGGNDV